MLRSSVRPAMLFTPFALNAELPSYLSGSPSFPLPPPFSSSNIGYKCYTLYALLVDALVIVADTLFYKSARAAVISQEHQHERNTHPLCPIASSVPTWDSCGTHVLGFSLKYWGIGYGWVPDHRDRRHFGPCLRSHF